MRTSTAEGNRYTYTGREWDEELGLYHYRARMYDSFSGRFLGRDPIGYRGGVNLFKSYFAARFGRDPFGLAEWQASPDFQSVRENTIYDNDFLRTECDRYRNRRGSNIWIDPDTNRPKKPEDWHPEYNRRCRREILRSTTVLGTPIHSLMGSLRSKGCHITWDCTCCPSMSSGGGFSGTGNTSGHIGHINICANNNTIPRMISIFHHELVHANQRCSNRNQNKDCLGSLKREMEAYYCQGACHSARGCLYRALPSSCKDNANYCDAGSDLSDEVIADLIWWFENTSGLCRF